MKTSHFQRRLGNLTQKQAAETIGVSLRTWQYWQERGGKIPDPWIYKARALLEKSD